MVKWDEPYGEIHDRIAQAIKISEIAGDIVEFKFNGDSVMIYSNHVAQVYAEWSKKREERQKDNDR